jgi:hypothetical protein
MATALEIVEVPTYVSDDEMDTNETVNNGNQKRMKNRERNWVEEMVFNSTEEAEEAVIKDKSIMYILIVMNVKLIQLYDEAIFIVQSLIYEHVSMILYRFIISLVFVLFAKKGDVIYIFYFFSLFYDRHKIILFKKNQEKNASHLLFSNSILLFKLIQHDLVDRNTIFCEFSELFHAIVQSLVILFFILRRKK